ncbi:MAG TPA: hypothetical protein VGI63_01575 [Verrucomicrobiae bacterium]|jgi:cell division protein FtsL
MIDDFTTFVRDIWQYKPVMIVLLVGLCLISALLVIDTHRHRKKQKKRDKPRH